MGNFVSFNIKTNKKSDALPMIYHCVNPKARRKSENITFPEYSKYNYQTPNIIENYISLTDDVEKIKGKKIQKNANHYLEGVLAFSYDKFIEDKIGFKNKIDELLEVFGKRIQEEFGFTYLGSSFHYDEGHIDKDTGEKKLNLHGHVKFINFDFNTNTAPFRKYQIKYNSKRRRPNPHFVKMQDIAGEVFSELGFKRGISKEITKRDHLEKDEFIKKVDQDKLVEKLVLESKGELENKYKKELMKREEEFQAKQKELAQTIKNIKIYSIHKEELEEELEKKNFIIKILMEEIKEMLKHIEKMTKEIFNLNSNLEKQQVNRCTNASKLTPKYEPD